MIEITEVLRQWLAGARRKQIARRLGLDPKTVRRYLRAGVRLSKIRRLLAREGVVIPGATLYRFATAVLGHGRRAATIPVADGPPGAETISTPGG